MISRIVHTEMARVGVFLVVILSLTTGEELPQFSSSRAHHLQCPLDSPEIYFQQVYEPGLQALLHEGRAFFGTLLETLDTFIQEDYKKEVEEFWIDWSEDIQNDQEFRAERIRSLWLLVIGRWEGGNLPWEQRIKRPLVSELLGAIGSEHVLLQNLLNRGVKEVLRPIKPVLAKLLRRVQSELGTSGDATPGEMAAKLEKKILEVEPTFLGNLLVAILHRQESGGLSFVGRLLEELALLIEAFRTKGAQHPYFWAEMSQLLEMKIPPAEEVVQKYASSSVEIIKTLILLLEGDPY